jgi:hypothetical protein
LFFSLWIVTNPAADLNGDSPYLLKTTVATVSSDTPTSKSISRISTTTLPYFRKAFITETSLKTAPPV